VLYLRPILEADGDDFSDYRENGAQVEERPLIICTIFTQKKQNKNAEIVSKSAFLFGGENGICNALVVSPTNGLRYLFL
jgi:hypothetical protein